MTRHGNAPVAPPSKPTTLDTYIQAAIDANAVATPSRSRRRRKKQHHHQPLTDLPDPFQAKPPEIPPPPPVPAKPKRRKRKSKLKRSSIEQNHHISLVYCKFRVRGLVSPEELEDEDEAAELQEEVRDDFSRFGELQELIVVQKVEERSDVLAGDVLVEFRDSGDAAKAFIAFDGNVFGGKTVTCAWGEEEEMEHAVVVVVQGILTPEELEDPDEVEDVKEEVMQIFTKHGVVEEMELDEATGDVTVTFSDSQDAEKVVSAMNGSRYGGRVVTARLVDLGGEVGDSNESTKSIPVPLKETKRVTARLLQPTESAELQDLVVTFLKRLAALQERAHSLNSKQDKRSRRLVLGLHEVRRGLLNKKVRLLVIATDLDGCEAVAQEIAEIVAIAAEQEVPVLAPMNRRKLGRTLQNNVRVSCVGVYSVDGANDLFRQILRSMATK